MIIYILELEDNRYYIGKTNRTVEERFKDHMNGKGCIWTSTYRPKKIIETIETQDRFDEDKYVKKYMTLYGIDNVRGGTYSSLILSKNIISYLEREITSMTDKCYICKNDGHFMSDCELNKNIEKLYKESKYIESNNIINNIFYFIKSIFNTTSCTRCGRDSHNKVNCYATYDLTGKKLN